MMDDFAGVLGLCHPQRLDGFTLSQRRRFPRLLAKRER
jgi:hypothetical protein